MTRKNTLLVVTLAVWFLPAHGALAQLFGNRSLGSSISRQPSPSAASRSSAARPTNRASAARGTAEAKPVAGEVGGSLISEDARFVRGNRAAADFVGTDVGETQQFVGSQQAGGDGEEIRSAIDELQVELAPDANQTAAAVRPPRVPMYAPRLRIDFEFSPPPSTEVSDALVRRLQAVPAPAGSSRIEVSVEGGVATLRGAVACARDRKLAELLVGFEPGIASVQNRLTVRSARLPPPLPPPVRD